MDKYKDPNSISMYELHGDTRPTSAELEAYLSHMRGGAGFSPYLIMADMCIDLACERPEAADDMIKTSSQHLGVVIARAYELKDRGDMPALARAAPAAVSAILRSEELVNWNCVAKGQPVRDLYEDYLMAAYEAEDFCQFHGEAMSRLVEFMPILFGYRAYMKRSQRGWLGLLSLHREGHRPVKRLGTPNWDCALVTDTAPDAYQSPQSKIEMKTSKNSLSGSVKSFLQAHGVARIVADECGLDAPASIIAGCLHERGSLPDDMRDVPYMSPRRLDAVTENIAVYAGFPIA
jgi:hypothetical protein